MDFPKVISIYSRTSNAGKKTLAINTFLSLVKSKPGTRIFIVDFSLTEKLRYSLSKYGKSHFQSLEFLSEISDDILVNESLILYESENKDSFVRVLTSAGCQINEENLTSKIKTRVNSLFYKDIIDILVFILPTNLEENTITMGALLESDMVWFISTGKYPSLKLTKSTVQNFFNYLTVPTILILNMINPPIILNKIDTFLNTFEDKIRGPVFYWIPWTQDLHEFSDEGVYALEYPKSAVNEIFHDFTESFEKAVETGSLGINQPETVISPQALFMADRFSGSTMFYHFFGKAQDEMKNPALITAALSGIAHMISETAGRQGDLRGIDNGNSYIDFQYGENIIGILYSTGEDLDLSKLLFGFTNRFEKEFTDALKDFTETGRIGGFSNANDLVSEVFDEWIFEINTVSTTLRENIINYQSRSEKIKVDPEEAFQNYVKENISDPKIINLLYYEFTTPHNLRHEFLLDLGLNPRHKVRSIEEEMGGKICECTEPPKYVQIQGFDALGLLDLPEKLRPTARALFISKTLSPEAAAKFTKRSQDIEQEVLEELTKLGYVRKITTNAEE
ncbi:MAG: hypothetical protein ACXAB2_07920 [Candidatus Hodarchaeales archaeon]|jgi:hypothetical protein